MSTEDNPIQKVYTALWEMLDDSTRLKEMVKPGNQIKFTGSHAWKDQVAAADLPEMQLVPTVTTPHLQRTSNGSSMLERFAVRIATGDQRLDKVLFEIRWEVYRAMADWSTRLTALTWKSNTFVRLVRPVTITEALIDNTADRGLGGTWFQVWSGECEMWFTTTDLQGA